MQCRLIRQSEPWVENQLCQQTLEHPIDTQERYCLNCEQHTKAPRGVLVLHISSVILLAIGFASEQAYADESGFRFSDRIHPDLPEFVFILHPGPDSEKGSTEILEIRIEQSFVSTDLFAEISNPKAEAKSQQIISRWRDGTRTHGTSYYKYDGDRLVLVREKIETHVNESRFRIIVRELRNGKLVEVRNKVVDVGPLDD